MMHGPEFRLESLIAVISISTGTTSPVAPGGAVVQSHRFTAHFRVNFNRQKPK